MIFNPGMSGGGDLWELIGSYEKTDSVKLNSSNNAMDTKLLITDVPTNYVIMLAVDVKFTGIKNGSYTGSKSASLYVATGDSSPIASTQYDNDDDDGAVLRAVVTYFANKTTYKTGGPQKPAYSFFLPAGTHAYSQTIRFGQSTPGIMFYAKFAKGEFSSGTLTANVKLYGLKDKYFPSGLIDP